MVVRAFGGSRQDVRGEIDLPIKIGPHVCQITFQVMDINPAYNCLLGRPWIHLVGVVPSMLHQKCLKQSCFHRLHCFFFFHFVFPLSQLGLLKKSSFMKITITSFI